MSLYTESIFDGDWKKIIIMSVIIIALIVGLYFLITNNSFSTIGNNNNISAKFNHNPLVLSKNTNTLLEVNLKNNSEIDANNSILSITPVEDALIVFCQDSNTPDNSTVVIKKIGAGNQRTIYCDIRYSEIDKILEGTYSFDIKYTLNNNNYFKRIKLAVRR